MVSVFRGRRREVCTRHSGRAEGASPESITTARSFGTHSHRNHRRYGFRAPRFARSRNDGCASTELRWNDSAHKKAAAGFTAAASCLRRADPQTKRPPSLAAAMHVMDAQSSLKRLSVLGRPGSDLLFQALRLSTIGAGEFNGRVRDGIGYRLPANTTRPAKNRIRDQ